MSFGPLIPRAVRIGTVVWVASYGVDLGIPYLVFVAVLA